MIASSPQFFSDLARAAQEQADPDMTGTPEALAAVRRLFCIFVGIEMYSRASGEHALFVLDSLGFGEEYRIVQRPDGNYIEWLCNDYSGKQAASKAA